MKLAIVIPRYAGTGVGGAKTQALGFAEEAARRGWAVDVWTTRAEDHYTFENVLPAGQDKLNGVTVHRFPITSFEPRKIAVLEEQLLASGQLPTDKQYKWLDAGAHSAPLYAHVARQAEKYDAVIGLPYASPLIQYAAWAAPEQFILWPCLHDEPYAYFEPVRLLMDSVHGLMFLSPEEQALATKRLAYKPRRQGLVGGGASLVERSTDDSANSSYLAYIGRLETGKNLTLLYQYMQRYAEQGGTVRLQVWGKGPFHPPDHPAFDYQGYVAEEEKRAVYSGALALCQPSLNESFSMTIMESWLAGRPVLVSERCSVTKGHVSRSKGGLWFDSYEEFAGACDWLMHNRTLADRMGQNGRRYVEANFSWAAVVDRFQRIMSVWTANNDQKTQQSS